MKAPIPTILFAVMLIFGSLSVDAARIELRESVQLSSLYYRLDDIARVDANDSAASRSMRETLIGKAPRPGYVSYVTQREIAAELERQFPGSYRRLHWSGPARVSLTTVAVGVAAEQIENVAHEYLHNLLSGRYERISLQRVGGILSLSVPPGRLALKANLPDADILSRRMAVWVDVSVDGEAYQTVPVWFAVSAFAPALVAKQRIQYHDVLREDQFQIASVDIAAAGGKPVAVDRPLNGMRLTRAMNAGEVLLGDDLQVVPLVVKGERVTVYAQSGKVSLSTTAVALHDGVMLQRVNVQQPDTLQSYPAMVIGQGLVKVD